MSVATHPELDGFARNYALDGLTESTLRAIAEGREGYSIETARRFLAFQARIDEELLRHPIITDNAYTAWFELGHKSHEQIMSFIVQFSVFSNQFLVAQLQKTLNADTLEGMRASKEILANEIGVVFNSPAKSKTDPANHEGQGDAELVSTEGTVDGGVFRFRAAHFEWLLRIAEKLGLRFDDIGRRVHGTDSTLLFCDELIRLYGSEDYMTSQAASYAVENWAAAGFWDQLVSGLVKFNEQMETPLPLAFFAWHARIEGQHAQHTQEELEELYFDRVVDEDAFIETGNEMLEGVAAFWNGLDEQRRRIAAI
jgi:pyrroloquinoline quinone (PQQ) biosynthesis protein C